VQPDERNGLLAARQALTNGNLAESESLCRGVLAVHSQSVHAMLLLAEIATRAGRPSEATQLLRNAITLDPDNVKALMTLARNLRTVRAQAEAVELCRRAIEIEPENPEPHFVQGICYIDLWRIPESIAALQEAVRLNPNLGPAFDRLGYALQLRGRYEESILAY
jgi:tetratricopeptide (TPR) repeat protein